eukprot:gene19946-21899_t
MVQVEIRGIEVDFPFKPYKCQIDYMEKVITCLQDEKNGVLESPTGTGKTLCLLCAALAWRQTFVAHAQLTQGVMHRGNEVFHKDLQETLALASGNATKGAKQLVPKIIYASRTHSQLSQAINELKNTIYNPKVCVLGSRDQMCINPEVLKLDGSTAKIYACKGKISTKSCMFFNNLDSQKENTEFSEHVLDIEDLAKLGDKNKVCPYYMSRELRTNADLIFMPYNYVLDFKSRHANSIDLNGTIILLDEAHNVEQICEDTASFDLTSFDLASCMEDCDECIRILQENSEVIEEGDDTPATSVDIVPEDVLRLKMIFSNIEAMIEKTELNGDGKFQEEGSYLYKALDKQNVNASTVLQIQEAIDKCNTLLANNTSKVHKSKHFAMQKMTDVLKILFCRTGEPSNLNLENSRFYKVFIHAEEMTSYQKNKLDIWSTNKRSSSGRTLSYWCFNPGLSMKDLMSNGIRTLILTSGTLSPLDSFTSELGIAFPVQLQNSHVITNKQIWAGIVTKGPDGVELNSSFHSRFTDKYLSSLGNLLVNLARTTPHGALVFFSSYPVMDKSIEFWTQNGTLQRIEKNKAYFTEPRNKKMLNGIMEQFYDKVNDPALKGAIFFAVCRGKVSEGLDFANENGRVVIVTGLPFPPRKDPRVELKMQYLDNPKSRSMLRGKQWYRQQASRAVNQAVGRVIRHNQDYGAIWLCDVRFSYPEAKEQLPVWIKPHVKTYPEFGLAQRSVIQFFRVAENFVTPICPKSQTTALCSQENGLSSNASSGSSSGMRMKSFGNAHAKSYSRHEPSTEACFNSSASNSLAVLKRGECRPAGKESVFLSLNGLTGKKEEITKVPSSSTMSAEIFNDKGSTGCADETSRSKSRKMKMVMRKDVGKEKSNSTSSAMEYVVNAKKSLPAEDFKKFRHILVHFKKTNDIQYLVDNFTKFFQSNISMLDLFEGMRIFVKHEEHIRIFDDAFVRLKTNAGLECIDSDRKGSHTHQSDQRAGNRDQKSSTFVKMDHYSSCKEAVATEPELKRQRMNQTASNLLKENQSTQKETKYGDFFPVLSDDEDSDENKVAATGLINPICIVCKKSAQAPHKASCSHVACYQCWLGHLKKTRTCPKCEFALRPKSLKKIFFSGT